MVEVREIKLFDDVVFDNRLKKNLLEGRNGFIIVLIDI